MRHHRNGGPPSPLPDPYSVEYQAQKIVLLELVVDPPDDGDRLTELIERLGLPPDSVEPAVSAGPLRGAGRGRRR